MGKKCPNCGFENTDEAIFCEECGNKLQEEVVESNVSTEESKQKEETIADEKVAEKNNQSKNNSDNEQKETNAGITLSKKMLICVGAAVVGIIILLLVLVIVFSSKGCGNNKTSNMNTTVEESISDDDFEDDADSELDEDADAEVSTKDIKTVKTYKYKSSGYFYYIILFRNDSKAIADISVKATAHNSADKVVGVKDDELAIDPGATSIVYLMFDNADKIKDAKYDLEVEKSEYSNPGIKNIKSKVDIVGDKAIVKCKNVGNHDLDSAEAFVIFMNKGKVVTVGSTYVGDSDDVLKKGKSDVKEVDAYEKFDKAVVYFRDPTEK